MGFETIKYQVEFAEESIEELEEIYEYIFRKLRSSAAARQLLEKIQKRVFNLQYMPYLYREIEKTNRLDFKYHRIVVDNLIILYTIDEEYKKVLISHIFYGKKDYFENII